ncbi:MAG: SRPBCC domain-containing protein [Candidatus Dormibacteraeota bacterium]|nr:SRPBCC domain-containing protein [Candidatus Dormibacteraeota bacterium]
MAPQKQGARRIVTLERTLNAPIEDVWDLWTTKDGIESWWGPEGFAVKVRKLDLRPGGELLYAMTATAPDQIEFMKKAGMPLTTESRVIYTEVVPPRRLAYSQLADFIPGIEPYEVPTTVELDQSPQGVRMVLTFAAMHDEHWTSMAVMGWESELGKLAKLLEA